MMILRGFSKCTRCGGDAEICTGLSLLEVSQKIAKAKDVCRACKDKIKKRKSKYRGYSRKAAKQ